MENRRCSFWVELRTPEGKLVCKYDPRRHLVEYVHQGRKTLFDLETIGDKAVARETRGRGLDRRRLDAKGD